VIRTKSVDGKPAVLPGEHVGGGRGVEQPLHAEPPDHAATHPLGERGQVSLGDWPRWQERRRGVSACFGSSWHEDTVGCRSRGARTRDSRGARPRRIPARAARRLPARRASSRGSRTQLCGARRSEPRRSAGTSMTVCKQTVTRIFSPATLRQRFSAGGATGRSGQARRAAPDSRECVRIAYPHRGLIPSAEPIAVK
jgi:hypothetical protein